MIKNFIIKAILFVVLSFLCFFLHNFILEYYQIVLPFSLKKVYFFHVSFSLLILVNFLLLLTVDKISERLGFIYLGLIFFKLMLFTAAFNKSLLSEESLLFSSKISLLLPTIIFLLTEAVFVIKILKRK
ncbi:DUF6168 family protein [Polaribacter sargassicola]|uniref:DUF6168 family protein n=1 Tax=Polaribacter sargassicola TaxID=2836891 RepID=UPI001F25AFCD|nr:DUF6168 family protein [Polaribacter sp. DS7-9]